MRRWDSGVPAVVAAFCIALGGLPIGSGPVAAAGTPVTVVTLEGPEDNSMVLGRAWTFAPPAQAVNAVQSGASTIVSVSDGTHRFAMTFAAADGAALAPGTYAGATSEGGVVPTMRVQRDSSGCSGETGAFEVLEAPVIDGEHVTAFAADFTSTCGGPVMTGRVRIGSPVDIAAIRVATSQLVFPAQVLFTSSATKPVAIDNVGTLPATVVIETAGPQASSFTVAHDCPSVLPAGQGCTASVAVFPMTVFSLQARLVVSSDAAGLASQVPLVGTASLEPVGNGSAATAIAIDSLPFRHGGDTTALSGSGSWQACPGSPVGLWYTLALAQATPVRLDPTAFGAFVVSVATAPDVAPTLCSQGAPLTFTAQAGQTYWIRVAGPSGSTNPERIALIADVAEDDAVTAANVSLDRTTFYPVVDGYQDTVTASGDRLERIDVKVEVFGPDESKVRTLTAAAAEGPYALAWNGKSSGGTLQPAGNYRIVQTLTDQWGNAITFEGNVSLSRKKLEMSTFSKTFNAADFASKGGSVSKKKSSYAGGVRLTVGSSTGTSAVGYQVTVPAATVYKKIRFEALSRGAKVTYAYARGGIQRFTKCTGWDLSCVGSSDRLSDAYGWDGTSATTSDGFVADGFVADSRVVRGYVWVSTAGLAKWQDVRDVRFTVVYGVLK